MPFAEWESRYRRLVIACDVAVVTLTCLVVGGVVSVDGAELFKDLAIGGLTVVVLLCSLAMNRGWHTIVLGQGPDEYLRLVRGMFAAAVALGLAGLATGVVSVRSWVFVVIPVVAVAALLTRRLLRAFLHRMRRAGRCLLPVLAAGAPDTVAELVRRTTAKPELGWHVSAVCVGGTPPDSAPRDPPLLGDLDDVAEQVRRGSYRIVAITADPHWTAHRLQRLAWCLEGSGAQLVIAPTVMEVAGARLHVSGVLGMPMLQVSAPAFTGMRRMVKGATDRVAAAVLLLVALPLMLVAALAIALDSRGPVLYRQRRVGRAGTEFVMLKFRTMVRDADRLRSSLAAANEGAGVLFKLQRDPRVTKVGAVLRRFSVDELPQLFNVLTGAMSLVGPRPPLPEECAGYEPDMRRRLLVKPGMTGLWQVSGRSDLSWEEAVRLDLRYVEDWSLSMDAVILWKTARAVLRGQGAY